jgi:hypothetical protein
MENNVSTNTAKQKKKKAADLNFKKWLLSLSSIGNAVLGTLLVIMGIQYLFMIIHQDNSI